MAHYYQRRCVTTDFCRQPCLSVNTNTVVVRQMASLNVRWRTTPTPFLPGGVMTQNHASTDRVESRTQNASQPETTLGKEAAATYSEASVYRQVQRTKEQEARENMDAAGVNMPESMSRAAIR